jgi:hypothetical protein
MPLWLEVGILGMSSACFSLFVAQHLGQINGKHGRGTAQVSKAHSNLDAAPSFSK